jgi:hypothetical protein
VIMATCAAPRSAKIKEPRLMPLSIRHSNLPARRAKSEAVLPLPSAPESERRTVSLSIAELGLVLLGVVLATGCELVLGGIPEKPDVRNDAATQAVDATTQAVGDAPFENGISSDARCDRDGDTFDSPSCGGTDCDDTNGLVYPMEPTYYEEPTQPGGSNFDYDCSGTPDPKFDSIDCAALTLVNCESMSMHFLGPTAPACGQKGPFGHCKTSGVMCIAQVVTADQIMPCK